ncbi:hypothetical protein ScalyP_jg1061 [Parmales sp. scaly parma]|nr:hypothetical protein ScalyP_jg1061 [Parmales sp. scaly parma]
MPNDREIDAPTNFAGLWPDSDDEQEDFTNKAETQTITVADIPLKVRQYCYHSHNANRVWPGTFNLAEYYISASQPGELSDLTATGTTVLELGSATGVLAMRFTIAGVVNLATSDFDDTVDGEESIENNIRHNYEANALGPSPRHIPHTWGETWDVAKTGKFTIVLASDILLYVSTYPQLVKTLKMLFEEGGTKKFVMSWDRRMDESRDFFDRMEAEGFDCLKEPKCIFVFTKRKRKRL